MSNRKIIATKRGSAGKTKKKGETVPEKALSFKKEVFIVNGTDHAPMNELKVILERVGLKPMVLHEQPSGGRTIVEKLEKYFDVGYPFVILTPDDIGSHHRGVESKMLGAKMLLRESNFRARQNVILEFGYFMGKLGRDKVCCLLKGSVDQPSGMHGIVYIRFHTSIGEIRNEILKELEAAGYPVKP